MRLVLLSLFLTALSVAGFGAVVTRSVDYQDGKTVLQGFLALPEGKGPWPGVLIAHSWNGHDAYVERRARELAEAGYAAFALDMYGKGVYHQDPKDAGAASGAFKKDRPAMQRRARKGLDLLARTPGVDRKKLVAMGYCFGGTVALELARSGAGLSGVAVFHGGLDTPKAARKGAFPPHVLVLQGGDDPWVTPKDVAAFEDEMRAVGTDWQVNVYGGAVHAFSIPEAGDDPSVGAAYDRKADLRSWEAFLGFLRELR